MKFPEHNPALFDETEDDRRQGILSLHALSLDVVSAIAGDRPLTRIEVDRIKVIEKNRGIQYFSDLLYSITHQYFSPEIAKDLWVEVLCHKSELSIILRRNVRITVAALDYLSNITDNMNATTLVGEPYMREILGLSLRDGLTGLFNHTYFYQQIDLEVRRFLRYGTLVSLVLIDVDDFKEVNDTFGHREGDRVLATMSKILMGVARDSDICCRYGGEEFAIILPLTDTPQLEEISKRLNKELVMHLKDGQTVTVSIGAASCGKKTSSYRDLVEKADGALYRVKRSGKNSVYLATDEEAATDIHDEN